MVEQKTTKEILSTAIKDFDVFPSQKGVLIYVDQELDNQVWFRKDEVNKVEVELRRNNPYPSDIFIPMSDKDVKRYVKLLIDNGFSSDGIHGNWGRHVWTNCCNKLNELLRDIDGSLAQEATTTGERLSPTSGGSKHTKDRNLLSMGLKAETEKCNVIARETPSVSAENIKDEEKKDEVK